MSTKLFVRNLSWSVAEAELYDLFTEAGDVISVKIPTRREDGKPRGFAFVEMADSAAAQEVIQRFNGYVLYDRDIVVAFQDEDRGHRGDTSARPGKSSKLFVRNLSRSVSDGMLQDLFQQAGTVYSVRIPTDRETGEPRGFGFIEMASVDDAQQAIDTLSNTVLEGKEISIDFQDPTRNRSRPAHTGGYNKRW